MLIGTQMWITEVVALDFESASFSVILINKIMNQKLSDFEIQLLSTRASCVIDVCYFICMQKLN